LILYIFATANSSANLTHASMETVTNVVSAAKNAIWGGENNPENVKATTTQNEPLSGETGKGTPAEPFDKGNEQPDPTETSTSTGFTGTAVSEQPASEQTSTGQVSAEPASSDTTTSGSNPQPTSSPAMTGPGPVGQLRPETGDRPGDVRPTEANENRPNVNAGGFGTAEPSVSADPSSAQKPTPKHEGADRPMASPSSGEEDTAVKESKAAGESAQSTAQSRSDSQAQGDSATPKIASEDQRQELAAKGELPRDPNDHSGEPLQMHGGDAGKEADEGEDEPQEQTGERNQSIGQAGGHPHGKEKGTGEEWVKTSGLAAEGGDFDATKPGAGREATRLMEVKGIHGDAPQQPGASDDTSKDSADHGSAGKESKMQKLKEKLHIGSGRV
jgi:hypothetical protein